MVVQSLSVDGSNALLSRFVHLHMEAQGYNHEVEQRIHKLRQIDLAELASFRNKILTSEQQFLSRYFEEFEKAHKILVDKATKLEEKFKPRILHTHSQLLALAHTLQTVFGKEQITDLQLRNFTSYIWQRCQDRQHRLKTEHPMLQQFWDYYEILNWRTIHDETGEAHVVERLNHGTGTDRICVNLTEFDEACGDHKLQLLDLTELKKMFPNSTKHWFIENKPMRSKLPSMKGRSRSCWIFQQSTREIIND